MTILNWLTAWPDYKKKQVFHSAVMNGETLGSMIILAPFIYSLKTGPAKSYLSSHWDIIPTLHMSQGGQLVFWQDIWIILCIRIL